MFTWAYFNGQSAAKPRIEERSTTRAYARKIASDWLSEAVGTIMNGEDIVYSLAKVRGRYVKEG